MEKEEREEKRKEDEERGREKQEDEDDEEDGGVELEQRNTDSVFSELLELSHDYVESVDQGASVRGELISQSPSLQFPYVWKKKTKPKMQMHDTFAWYQVQTSCLSLLLESAFYIIDAGTELWNVFYQWKAVKGFCQPEKAALLHSL